MSFRIFSVTRLKQAALCQKYLILLAIFSSLGSSSHAEELLSYTQDSFESKNPLFSYFSGNSTRQEVFNSQEDASHHYLITKYPVILAHGLFGSDVYILGVDYFYKVPQFLAEQGYSVYVTKVPAIAPISVRAKALARQIDQILLQTGAEKVNLIGHSMGGLDGRLLIAQLGYGDRIASLTTIGTPHKGTSIADVALGKLAPRLKGLAKKAVLTLFSYFSGYQVSWESAYTTIEQLTREYINDTFEFENPYDNRVYYQSFGGKANMKLWLNKSNNEEENTDEKQDKVSLLLATPHNILNKLEGANDGLVGFDSSIMEQVNNHHEIGADHLDQVGHPIIKLTTLGRKHFNHKLFYARILSDLAQRGF